MGNSNSTNDSKKINESEPEKTKAEITKPDDDNAKKLIEKTTNPKPDLQDEDTDKIVETLGDMTEIKKENEKVEPVEQTGGKKKIPMFGGNYGFNLSETSDNVLNGFQNKSGRKRYTKYDLFKILRDLDVDTEVQEGGANEESNVESKNESSLNDDESMEHIKNMILKELSTLKNNKSKQVGGSGCGCSGSNDSGNKNSQKLSTRLNKKKIVVDDDSQQHGGAVIIDDSSSTSSSSDDSSSSEMGKNKKSKKSNKSNKSKPVYSKPDESESDANSNFLIETSESGMGIKNSETSNGDDDETNSEKSNGESEEGLSIFPFNSSDVKSSRSIKNYRMLRRKI